MAFAPRVGRRNPYVGITHEVAVHADEHEVRRSGGQGEDFAGESNSMASVRRPRRAPLSVPHEGQGAAQRDLLGAHVSSAAFVEETQRHDHGHVDMARPVAAAESCDQNRSRHLWALLAL